MSDLKLFLLGPPRLERDNQVVNVGLRKAMALLAYLAVTGQPQSRDALAALFWPDDTQRDARANLRRALSRLNRALGKGQLASDREHISLADEANLALDVSLFQQQLGQCETHDHSAADVCPDCLSPLIAAADYYVDDFLAGFSLPDCPAFDEWQFFQAEGLQQELAGVLTRLVDCLIAQGEAEAALPHARRRLDLDPLHEPAHRQLMRLYAQSGQQAAALRQYQRCTELLESEFDAPPADETTALFEQIRSGRWQPESKEESSPTLPQPDIVEALPNHNLPPPATPFIGRESELAALDDLIAKPEVRLVTIVGPGGMGKTRLGLAVAERQPETDRLPNGVYFVDLAPLSEAGEIIPALAAALNFPMQSADRSPRQQILDYLRQKRMLIVMDNFEHLLDGVELVADMIQAAPELQILVTSRERLKLHQEQVYPIRGLEFPNWETPEDAAEYTAVKLFLQSAGRVRPDFRLQVEDLVYLTRICRLVEGMPLGVELAASWVDMLSLADIAAEIQLSLDFLETEVRNIPERHRSMRAVFDASWQRLNEQEQVVFAQLSIFRGGFTRQAGREVTGASLRTLAALANKSLLRYSQRQDRYQIHELLRQYGAEQLDQTLKLAEVRGRHSLYHLEFLRQQEQHLKGPKLKASLAAINADIDNVRLAWRWALAQERWTELTGVLEVLWLFYEIEGGIFESNEMFTNLVDRLRSQADEAEIVLVLGVALGYLSYTRYRLGQLALAKESAQESVTILRSLGGDARRELAVALFILGEIVSYVPEYEVARIYMQESLALFKVVEDPWGCGLIMLLVGQTAHTTGVYNEAEQCLQESLAVFREIGEQLFSIYTLNTLGRVSSGRGKYKQAEEIFQDCLQRRTDLGDQIGILHVLTDLGEVALLQREVARAEGYFRQCLRRAREIGLNFRITSSLWGLSRLAEQQGDYLVAKQLFEEAYTAFPTERGYEILGWILLGLKDYQAAEKTFYKVLTVISDSPKVLLRALAGLAHVWAEIDQPERALELLTLVLNHPVCEPDLKGRSGPLQTQLAAQLPPEAVRTAQERGEAQSLETVVKQLLSEKDTAT